MPHPAYVIDQMISAKAIAARVEALAAEITAYYQDCDKLVVVGKGGATVVNVPAGDAKPVDLADTVELDAHWNLVHATHVTQSELGRITSAGARVVICPLTANA